jgi:N-formylglutamate amidohydrolase
MDGGITRATFELQQPTVERVPLIVASPHSGSNYPVEFVAASRLDPLALRRSEDSFVDELFAAAPSLGAPLLSARYARAYVDVNREPYELDPTMFVEPLPEFVNAQSPRVRMGLGTIARVVANGQEIYSGKLHFDEAQRRIETLYHPYHQTLRRLIEETEALFGGYVLVDCHSMPSAAGSICRSGTADIVLGDCHGTACAPEIREAARRFLSARGFAVAINAPYAGGYTTEHYGDPPRRRHALQVEINRALYMDERQYARTPRFSGLIADLAELLRQLARAAEACLLETV